MSEEFQDYIARIARERGVSGETTRERLDALRAQADATVRENIGKPVKRLGLRMFPAPRTDKLGRLKVVEARVAIDPQDILDASVKETETEGVDVVLLEVRKALIGTAVRQLVQDGYGPIRVEGQEAVVTLIVASPIKSP